MKVMTERRLTPDIPRPEHGQRRGDRIAARALAEANGPSLLQRAVILWGAAAALGGVIGVALLN